MEVLMSKKYGFSRVHVYQETRNMLSYSGNRIETTLNNISNAPLGGKIIQ